MFVSPFSSIMSTHIWPGRVPRDCAAKFQSNFQAYRKGCAIFFIAHAVAASLLVKCPPSFPNFSEGWLFWASRTGFLTFFIMRWLDGLHTEGSPAFFSGDMSDHNLRTTGEVTAFQVLHIDSNDPVLLRVLAKASNADTVARAAAHSLHMEILSAIPNGYTIVSCLDLCSLDVDTVRSPNVDSVSVEAVLWSSDGDFIKA
ncbi:hypothetical protein AKJ16_DCAP22259 [Drosera capensis]